MGTGGAMYDKINQAMVAYEANRNDDEFTLPQSQTGGGGVSVKYRLTYAGKPEGNDRLELACGIFMHAQSAFEAYQGSFLGGGLVTRSSFSVEDLPSDYLSFMISAGVIKKVKDVCGEPLTKEDSQKMWKYGDSPHGNESHVPQLSNWTGEYNLEIGGGLGTLKGKIWRVGLMGYSSSESNAIFFLTALEQALRDQGFEVPRGAGATAAKDFYSKAK